MHQSTFYEMYSRCRMFFSLQLMQNCIIIPWTVERVEILMSPLWVSYLRHRLISKLLTIATNSRTHIITEECWGSALVISVSDVEKGGIKFPHLFSGPRDSQLQYHYHTLFKKSLPSHISVFFATFGRGLFFNLFVGFVGAYYGLKMVKILHNTGLN